MLTIKVFITCYNCDRMEEIAVSTAPLPDTGYVNIRILTPLPERWQRTSYGPLCKWCLAAVAELPTQLEQENTHVESRLRAYVGD